MKRSPWLIGLICVTIIATNAASAFVGYQCGRAVTRQQVIDIAIEEKLPGFGGPHYIREEPWTP